MQGTLGDRNAKMGPDGYLYLLTSNQDGRGTLARNDDRILRITSLESDVEDSFVSPLKQIKSGILSENVSCRDGFGLVIKASNEMPACVKESSAGKLVERGWAISKL